MPEWLVWLLLGLGAWAAASAGGAFALGRAFGRLARLEGTKGSGLPPSPLRMRGAATSANGRTDTARRVRILVVDDDPPFRALLAATLAGEEFELAQAGSVEEARAIAAGREPHVVLLDVSLPGVDGLVFCAELQELEHAPSVVLLTGSDVGEEAARSAGAGAILRKPFSPLQLLDVVARLTAAAGTETPAPSIERGGPEDTEQLIAYARDLSRVIEVERAQRRLLESAYRQTVTALASTLEARDTGTTVHSLRVTRYALELAAQTNPDLLDDPTVVYGFLLHDIGKIGIPDRILLKEGPLDPFERRLIQRHPEIGAEILGEVAILQGEGLRIVRSHHERWDGAGYPDGLAGEAIPRGARVFAAADALDALTSDRPYRRACEWRAAIDEIEREAGRQFEPVVVQAILREEDALREIHDEVSARAA